MGLFDGLPSNPREQQNPIVSLFSKALARPAQPAQAPKAFGYEQPQQEVPPYHLPNIPAPAPAPNPEMTFDTQLDTQNRTPPQPTSSALAALSQVNPGILPGIGTGIQQAQGIGALASGKNPSFMQHVALFPLLGGASLLGGLFGGENPRVKQRKQMRQYLDQLIPGRTIQTPNGKPIIFDHHEMNPAMNSLQAEAIALMDPIAEALTAEGADAKDTSRREDMGAILARAIADASTTPDDLLNNALHAIGGLKVTMPQVISNLSNRYKQGAIDDNRLNVYAGNLAKLTGMNVNDIIQQIAPGYTPPTAEVTPSGMASTRPTMGQQMPKPLWKDVKPQNQLFPNGSTQRPIPV